MIGKTYPFAVVMCPIVIYYSRFKTIDRPRLQDIWHENWDTFRQKIRLHSMPILWPTIVGFFHEKASCASEDLKIANSPIVVRPQSTSNELINERKMIRLVLYTPDL